MHILFSKSFFIYLEEFKQRTISNKDDSIKAQEARQTNKLILSIIVGALIEDFKLTRLFLIIIKILVQGLKFTG